MYEDKLSILDGIHGSKVIAIYETVTGEIVRAKKKEIKKWMVRIIESFPEENLEFKIVKEE